LRERGGALFAAALLGATPCLGAQALDPIPRYSPQQLQCAQFIETAQSTIAAQSGGRGREQTIGRRGVWQFRAAPSRGDIALEGWLDALSLWRRSPETTIRPDTDGLIGGRYGGILSPGGRYVPQVQPFVPDEVAEVAGMSTALDDFFPPLPPHALHPGEVWKDSVGFRVQRLSDSALSGLPLYRFALEAIGETRSAPVTHDTVPLRLHQVSRERGTFVWHPTLGLVKRERSIVIEATVPSSRTVRQAVRSRIEQRISVVRDLRAPVERCSPGKLPVRPAAARLHRSDTGNPAPVEPAPGAPGQ
jgi:hypothetical protein